MSTGFAVEPTRSVLDELHAYADREDPLARERVQARREELGGRLSTAEKYEVYGDAPPLAISPDEGAVLYLLVRLLRPASIVEFGSSHGISTIYLAAGLRDNGAGRLVSTEIRPAKADASSANLERAGLADLVELRLGDARETLADDPPTIDLAFLDGRNDLYLDVLALLEPRLSERALVVADLSPNDPDLEPYLAQVRDPGGPFAHVPVPFAPGFEVSARR